MLKIKVKAKEHLERALRESPYFQGLSSELLSALKSLAIIKRLAKGEHLFFEGEKALGFFLVVDGMMKLYKLSPKGKESVIHIFGPGEIFAEIALAGAETYPVNAVALTDAVLAFFPKAGFIELLKRKPEIGTNLIGLFGIRLKTLLKTVETLTLKEASERLACYLFDLSKQGKTTEVVLPIPKSQLALLLGVTAETLSRLFQRLKEEEIVAEEGKKIIINDIERLKKLCA